MRRGQLGDIATFIVILFVICVSLLVGWFVLGTWNDIVSTSTDFPQAAKDANVTAFGDYGSVFDNMILFLYIGVLLASLVLSYVLRSQPGMFFALVIIVFLFSMVAGYLGNAWTSVSQTVGLTAAADSFTITAFLMDNYLLFSIINTILMIIVFFAKPNDGVLA